MDPPPPQENQISASSEDSSLLTFASDLGPLYLTESGFWKRRRKNVYEMESTIDEPNDSNVSVQEPPSDLLTPIQAFGGLTRLDMVNENHHKFPTEMTGLHAQLSDMPFLFDNTEIPLQDFKEHYPVDFDITASINSYPYSSFSEDESRGILDSEIYDQQEDQAFLASSRVILPNTMPTFDSPHNPPCDDQRARGTSETKGCKRCNCKKTECLKLYCECFRSGVYCKASCACEICYNNSDYEDTVEEARQRALSRNALAFSPKIINQVADVVASAVEERSNAGPSSARHKIGCNCKKSKCLKKYCECYQVDVGCSDGCRCEDCNNPYGKKPELRQRGRWKRRTVESADIAQPSEDISHMTPLDKSLAEMMSAPRF